MKLRAGKLDWERYYNTGNQTLVKIKNKIQLFNQLNY